jgi:O-antigen/teichoic acid export membrane protein
MSSASTSAAETPPEFRQHVKKISHQSSVFLLGTLFTAVAGYFFKVYLARVLGAEALGIYALGMTVVGMAAIVAAIGLPQSASRFIAVFSASNDAGRLRKFFWSALAVLVVSNAVTTCVVLLVRPWIAGRLYHTPALFRTMPYFMAIMFAGSFTTFLGQALAGYQDVARRTVITSFFATAANMVITIVLLMLGWGLTGYLIAQIVSAALVFVLLARVVWTLTPAAARTPEIGPGLLEREIVSFSSVLFAVQALEFLLAQTDKVVLGFYLNAREVGIYAVASALVAMVPLALQSVNQIFSPMIADFHTRGQVEMLARLFRSLVKWTLALTLPLAITVILFAKPIMEIFGAEFSVGWPVLIVGTLAQLINCGVGSVGYLLLMSGRQNQLLRIQAVMAAILVVLNLILIPRMGLLGAATAVAVVTATTNLWYLSQVRRSLGIVPSLKKYASLLIPVIAAVAATLLFQQFLASEMRAWTAILFALVITYSVFVGISLVIALDSDDREIARAAWSKISASRVSVAD